ncbi:MAG TPA: hypothetical protein VLS28_11065 [Candidatus Sulfomarinibacteraceae bacterium]|nr:hypothetical protein [Candidatus Sulfomarinibacteraceae bacterium]
MTGIITRLRPLLISLVVLLFTAGIAFAGRPDAPGFGRATAAQSSGQTVPVGVDEEDEGTTADPASTTTETTAETEATTESEDPEVDGDHCSTDPTGLTDEQLAELNHGAIVCWAAHQETPAEYRNHGVWVSEWAGKNRGHAPAEGTESVTETAATTATTTTTETTTATAAAETGSDHPGIGQGRGKGR